MNPSSSANRDVLIALAPALLFAVVLFKLPALLSVLVSVGASLLSEWLFCLLLRRKCTLSDHSAAVTGLILALLLPLDTPLVLCAAGSVFATIVCKCLFGGYGKNIVNPAAAGAVFVMLTVGSETTSDSAAILAQHTEYALAFAFASLTGFAFLIVRKRIKWYLPPIAALTAFLAYLLQTVPQESLHLEDALVSALTCGILFGSIFLASDPVTVPKTTPGTVIFAFLLGLLVFIIDTFGAYAPALPIALLALDLIVPFLSDIGNRGRKKKGESA